MRVARSQPAPPARSARRPRPFTVGEVLAQVRACLEDQFLPVLVRGEVRDLRAPRSGHLYFVLRDARARLRVVVFASTRARLPEDLELESGQDVLVWGRISAYPASGDVQLIADGLEPAGRGALWAQRERLRRRLAAEGLFASERKRTLPALPRAVGVVTSPTGSALRDVLSTIERRYPGMRVVLSPARVNGMSAAPEVARAVRRLDRSGEVDVLLVVRGGGSQEDLAAFDAESLVRAVTACRVPVVAGIGHEDDVSLCDLAADRRAPTPSGAAELAVPLRATLVARLDVQALRLRRAMRRRLDAAEASLEQAARAHGFQAPRLLLEARRERLREAAHRLALASPAARLERRRQQLAAGEARLVRAAAGLVPGPRRDLENRAARLARLDLAGALRARRELLAACEARLQQALRRELIRRGQSLAAGAARLSALSPLAVLGRGYSLTSDAAGRLLHDARALQAGDEVRTRLGQGAFRARVLAVEPSDEDGVEYRGAPTGSPP